MRRGLEVADDAAVDQRETALRPAGRDHRRQVVVDLDGGAMAWRLLEQTVQEDADPLMVCDNALLRVEEA
jgi:hypothetical protein